VTVAVVAEKPNALRYRIADATTWALAAELLAERRPIEAEIAYRRARQLWMETIEQFPHAKHYVSGIHGHQTDWERFQGVEHLFRDLPASESEDKVVNTNETVFHQHSWSGRGWARAGLWKNAIGCFNRSAALRTQISDHDHAYDWLQLAMAHAELGEHDQAQTWLDKAEDSISHLSEPHVELIELRDEARSVVERKQNRE
jgi:tetratricopeptide (TPR) repeat protein